ncbi:hypothetical protein EGW08_006181 [Elysia chlorotica]|uniref:Uncharacterized protein n=1 Tax=Elysia chlorotica TaxID=188477 RepID=A0A433TWX4_ELYCH|nr:hypothetical protein EGW08_006181 [Elysia chlorotica]
MPWLNLLSLLTLVIAFGFTEGTGPIIIEGDDVYSHNCHPDYLVAQMDYAAFSYTVKGPQTLEYPFHQSLNGPYFKGKDEEGYEWTGCPVFQMMTNLCVKEEKPWTCSCVEGEDDMTFGFNMTVTKNVSGQPVWMEWRGPPVKKGKDFTLPEIRAACPRIKMLKVEIPNNKNDGFLVEGRDTLIFRFEVSGNNSFHTLTGYKGPQIKYTTTDDETHMACLAFDPATGACVSQDGYDACSCERQSSDKYLITYTKLAQLNISKKNLYMEWLGEPKVKTEMYTFPLISEPPPPTSPPTDVVEVEDIKAASMSRHLQILIGVGLAAAVTAIGGAVAYMIMFSGFSRKNAPAAKG